MNRFKGLDLVNAVPEELWKEVSNTVQDAVTKFQRKRNAGRLSGCQRRPYKKLRKEEK